MTKDQLVRKAISPAGQEIARQIVEQIVAEDPQLRNYIDNCRRIMGTKFDCQRNVFGECDLCDNRPSSKA